MAGHGQPEQLALALALVRRVFAFAIESSDGRKHRLV